MIPTVWYVTLPPVWVGNTFLPWSSHDLKKKKKSGAVPALVFAGDVLPVFAPGADVPRLAPRPQELGVGGVPATTLESTRFHDFCRVLFPPLCDRGLSHVAVGSPPALASARCGSRLELPPGAAFGVVCPGMSCGVLCF